MKLLALLLLLASGGLQAGVTLKGVVEDQSGAAIPKAKVTLTGGSGEARTAKTDGEGSFAFESVGEGEYTLRAKADSFETAETAVRVALGPMKPIRLRLQLSGSAQQVTITGERPETGIDPGENSDTMKLEENSLRELPSDGQNLLPVLGKFLSPASQGEAGPSVVIDGVESSGLNVPTWGIKRLRINKNPYSVQFRRPGSSRVEVTTRDGDREDYHGGAGLFVRNSALDARNAFAATKPELSKRLFETRVMGPVPGHKASFLVSAERLVDNQSALVNAQTLNGPVIQNVPTPVDRTTLMARLDLRPSEYHTMNIRYLHWGESEAGRGTGGFRLADQGIAATESEQSLQFSDRRITLSNLINDLRIVVERTREETGALASAPALKVSGAFTRGPSSTYRVDRETTLKIQNTTTYYSGIHTFRMGGQYRPRFLDATNGSNFAGTYEFASLGQFALGRPFAFRVNQGDPQISFRQDEASSFFQDEMKLRPNLNVTLGLRHEWQQNLANGHRLAPRVAIAYAPGAAQKTVFRVGGGLFYDPYPKLLRQRILLYDGRRVRELVVSNPAYPVAGLSSALPPSITLAASDLTLPMLFQWTASVERELTRKLHLTAEYQRLRGLHVYRARDTNAPLPGTGLRPDAGVLNRTVVESSASMRTDALNVTLRWNLKKYFSGTAQYSLAKSLDNTNGLFGLPANSYDLRPEWGRSDYDRRHRLNMLATASLPGRVRLGAVLSLSSGVPYDILTGADDNRDTHGTDRPSGVGRNTGSGPGMAQIDVRISKLFDVTRIYKPVKHNSNNLELSADLFNALNQTNFMNYIGTLSSPFFGRANAAYPARAIQLSFKYHF